MRAFFWAVALVLATISASDAEQQAATPAQKPVTQTFTVSFNAAQQNGFFELPVPATATQGLQVDGLTAQPVNAATGVVTDGIATALQGNGIVVLASAAGKPDVVLSPGSRIRITSYRTKPSAFPVTVTGTITTQVRR